MALTVTATATATAIATSWFQYRWNTNLSLQVQAGKGKQSQRLRLGIKCSASSAMALPPSSSSSSGFDLRSYWSGLIEEINQKLDESIPVSSPYTERIYKAMRYSVLAKGAKRAPPVMCITACELFGGHRLAAFPTACALEMVLLDGA